MSAVAMTALASVDTPVAPSVVNFPVLAVVAPTDVASTVPALMSALA